MAQGEVKRQRKNSAPDEVLAAMKAEYAAGASLCSLAKKYGVARTTLQSRARNEGWKQDAELAIQVRVLEKLAGISSNDDAVKRDAAIDAAAQKRADVRLRHRREWEQVASLRQQALQKRTSNPDVCFNELRIAKITAEMTEIQQRGEIKAWGLDRPQMLSGQGGESGAGVIVIDRV